MMLTPHKIVQDDDGHWYFIKTCKLGLFEALLEVEMYNEFNEKFGDDRIQSPADIIIWDFDYED